MHNKGAMAAWLLALRLLAVAADDLLTYNHVPKYNNDGQYTILVGQWGNCNYGSYPRGDYYKALQVDGYEISTDQLTHTTVLGIQYRNTECRRNDSMIVDRSFCEPEIQKVGTVRPCIVQESCNLRDWHPWRPRADGSQVRTRFLGRLPQGGGTECDVIMEVKPVVLEPTANWVPGPWGICKVAIEQPTIWPERSDDDDDDADEDNAIYEELDRTEELEDKEPVSSCGGGIQRREATCIRADGTELHPAQCTHTPMPTLVQPCEVPCPRDCEVGDWGEWSPCQPTDGCPLYPVQQLTSAGFGVRRRRVISAASGGGAPCPPLEEKRSCNNPKCASWHALPWGPCVLSQAHASCGPGRRSRDLRCVAHDGTEADRAWCGSGAPARSERCRIACPGDCVVSSWGAWSPCSAPCANPAHPRPYRTRRRHILAHSSPTGWACPLKEQLIQNETCNAHACATYSWLATPWGPCERRKQDFIASNYTDVADSEVYSESDDEEPCIEEGEMSRDVMCVQNNADVVREALCSPLRRPASRRACTVRCHRGCRLESWQPWSTCPNSCTPSKQTRTRVVHGGTNCGPRQETRDCPVPTSCELEKVKWGSSQWSVCVMAVGQTCGEGYRVRTVWCESDGRRVQTGLCASEAAPPTARRCHVPCARAAPLTCRDVCLNPLKYLDTAENNIPSCVCKNVSLELMPTDSDCILPPGTECGEGKVLRAARCLFKGRDVPMDVCKKYHPLTGPSRVREASTDGYSYDSEFSGLLRGACSVRCARDCAVGAWGEWGPCAAEPSSRTAFRFRTREVIEEGSGGGRECGATLQRATCTSSEPRWQAGEWAVCAAKPAVCGRAVQTRTVRCVDGSGLVLEDSACAGSGAGPSPARETSCRAPCPEDCVVSAWSEWSPCEQTKWGGRRDRTRVVLRAGQEGGASCPPLVAGEGCSPARHSWHVAPWDDCQPLGGSPCGEGTKKRSVRCLRSDGVFVDDSFCPNSTASEIKESWCYVPCGVDCELGEWGAWDTSACACGRTTTITHMRRIRQHLTAAVWPGRACAPAEQRAPCPREPCLRPVMPPPTLSCHVIDQFGQDESNACGWGVRVVAPRCEVLSPSDDAPTELFLGPWRCTQAPPGRLVLPPYEYLERPCEVPCGCSEAELGAGWAWDAWSPCRCGARSRSRQAAAPAPPRCSPSSKYVMIQWENCTNDGEAPGLLDVEPNEQRLLKKWVEKEPYHDGYTEGPDSVLAVVWTSTIILSMYGAFVMYRALVRCVRSRQMQKKVAKV